jgi:hypothetical protein
MRLSPKGLHRWYADCCKTPFGNSVPAIPFLGMARVVFELPPDRSEEAFGPIGIAHVKSAIGGARKGERTTLRVIVHATRLLAAWALRGLGHPTLLFDRRNRPTVTPQVLTTAERQILREHARA